MSAPPDRAASEPCAETEGRVLVLATGGRNAVLLHRALEEAGLEAYVCPDMDAVADEADRGAGVILLTARTLTLATTRRLRGVLDGQPHWSDLPLVVLVERGGPVGGSGSVVADALLASTSVTLLEEPVRPLTLVSAVQAALRARARQYEVRDLNAVLEDRNLQVRQLAAQLVVAEQAERQRIAHLLHDDLQQRLYGLSTVLALLKRTPAGENALVGKAMGILGEATQMARSLANEFSPTVLQVDRLRDILAWVAAEKRRKYGLEVEVDIRGHPVVSDPAFRILLYQSLCEILFNVVKHSGGMRARLVAWADGDLAFVRVEDDGAGFDPETTFDQPGGFGLFSVRERLRLVGGRFEVDSVPGGGTRVTLSVPAGATSPDST